MFWLPSRHKVQRWFKVKPTICLCCGDVIRKGRGALSRDPNLCASCSSIADGMGDEESLPGAETINHSKEQVVTQAKACTVETLT